MKISKKNTKMVIIKSVLLLLLFTAFVNGVYAQNDNGRANEYIFPNGKYWSLNAGLGAGAIIAHSELPSFQFILEPKLWLSPPLMVGAKAGVNYSAEVENNDIVLSNILTFEGQVFLRWNFLRFGRENLWNIFIQGGLGLISAYRGIDGPFDDVTETRGSLLADAALGITIPLGARWHIEPMIRGGYPHIWGASLTAGCKFSLPQNTITTEYRTEYKEIIKAIPPNEVVRIIKIAAIEFVLFGPDIGRYNIGIDRDAQQLNELVLNYTAQTLKENPSYRVRIEGHANPFTVNISEADDLMALSAMRSDTIAEQLKERGVSGDQMVIVAFGGTRNAASEWDVRNRNRRVELMIIQMDFNQE